MQVQGSDRHSPEMDQFLTRQVSQNSYLSVQFGRSAADIKSSFTSPNYHLGDAEGSHLTVCGVFYKNTLISLFPLYGGTGKREKGNLDLTSERRKEIKKQ